MTSVGVFADLTDQTMPLLDFARAVEEREFASLFLNEHTHLPLEHPTSHFPPGGDVPERYARFWDPYIALSFVAATTSLQIGTGVSLLGGPASQRNFDRIARWGDGWITMGETIERSRLRADLDALRQAWEGAGREDAGPRITLIHNPLPDVPGLADVVSVADALGVERVLYHVFDGDETQMLRRLDRARAGMPA